LPTGLWTTLRVAHSPHRPDDDPRKYAESAGPTFAEERFFLLHSGMGLTPAQVGAAVGRTDRAMRAVKTLSVREMLDSIWAEFGRHRQKRASEQASTRARK
jgi:hypothetical protein